MMDEKGDSVTTVTDDEIVRSAPRGVAVNFLQMAYRSKSDEVCVKNSRPWSCKLWGTLGKE